MRRLPHRIQRLEQTGQPATEPRGVRVPDEATVAETARLIRTAAERLGPVVVIPAKAPQD